MNKRLTAHFSGTVQGVGFRYTTERIARPFPVTGYVRNLPDGRVQVVAEGDETDLQDFLKALADSPMKLFIRKTHIEWEAASGQYPSFGIAQ